MTPWPFSLCTGIAAMLLAGSALRLQRHVAASVACALVTVAAGLTWHTLARSGAAQAAQHTATLLRSSSLALVAVILVNFLARHFAVPQSLRLWGLVAALAGAMIWSPGLRLPSSDAPDKTFHHAEPFVAQVRQHLRAQAAGSYHHGLMAAQIAALQGAEVQTLRALCPTPGRRGAPPTPALLSEAAMQSVQLGAALCRAVLAPLPEQGAASLPCEDATNDALRQQHVCRLAGELLAEAGLMARAQHMLQNAHGPGAQSGAALWRERNLDWPVSLAEAKHQATPEVSVWPDGRTLGPRALGFTLLDAPGSLIWHPGGAQDPAPWGVLCARSPYRGALLTAVPMPWHTGARPTWATFTLLADAGVAITFVGAHKQQTWRCPHGHVDARSEAQQLPQDVCQNRWTHVTLAPDVGPGGIRAAYIHGEYLLAGWAWRSSEAAVP